MTMLATSYYFSPLGLLKISVNATAVTEVLFCNEEMIIAAHNATEEISPVMKACLQQLEEYFTGKRMQFELPLMQKGTTFQQSVWHELMSIPFGSTISYLELSRRLGNIKAIRAAAATNGKNKIAVIIPCHRVIGSNKDLVGYAGGLTRKRWLLEHELKYAHGLQTLF